MILYLLGIFIPFYTLARTSVKNEPLKSHVDSFFEKTNRYLLIYKDQKTSISLEQLLTISNKAFFYSLLLVLISIIFPSNIEKRLIILFAPMSIITMLLSFSISWIQHHKKTFKEFFLNFQMLGLLFFPLMIFYFREYNNILSTDKLIQLFNPLYLAIDQVGIITFQLIWGISLCIVLYFGALVVAFPIYIVLYSLIIITASIIRNINKYIDNKNVIDFIVGIIAIIAALFNTPT